MIKMYIGDPVKTAHELGPVIYIVTNLFKGEGNPDDYYVSYKRS